MTDQAVDHFQADESLATQPNRRWRVGLTVASVGIVIAISLIVFQFVQSPPASNEIGLRGNIRIDVEPGIEVFFGDRSVGTGPVKVSWDEIFGSINVEPFAIHISPDAPSPQMTSRGGVTPEALAGEGSEIVWTKNSMSGDYPTIEPMLFAFKDVVLRRPDSTLDHVFVLDVELTTRSGKWKRFLVPIRLRSSEGNSRQYFAESGDIGLAPDQGWKVGGVRFGQTIRGTFKFRNGSPPPEVAGEITEKGLWKPGN